MKKPLHNNDLDALFGPAAMTAHMRPRDAVANHRGYASITLGERVAFIAHQALRELVSEGSAAARRSRPIEASFLCLGRRAEDARGHYVIIEHLPLLALGDAATVPVPVHARERARSLHPALDVVGWAHTHPGYGIFFSGPDKETCRDYGDDAVNLVYDPLGSKVGVALGAEMMQTLTLKELIGETRHDVAHAPPASDDDDDSPAQQASAHRTRQEGEGKQSEAGSSFVQAIVLVVLVLHGLILTGLVFITRCEGSGGFAAAPAASAPTSPVPHAVSVEFAGPPLAVETRKQSLSGAKDAQRNPVNATEREHDRKPASTEHLDDVHDSAPGQQQLTEQ
jgi:proteasome lid subunit RPN8/RPN11